MKTPVKHTHVGECLCTWPDNPRKLSNTSMKRQQHLCVTVIFSFLLRMYRVNAAVNIWTSGKINVWHDTISYQNCVTLVEQGAGGTQITRSLTGLLTSPSLSHFHTDHPFPLWSVPIYIAGLKVLMRTSGSIGEKKLLALTEK